MGSASKTTDERPIVARKYAQLSPAGPLPMTAISALPALGVIGAAVSLSCHRPRGAPAEPPPETWGSPHVTTVLDLAIQVADALHFAHERDVVHRDVKPANILIREDGTALQAGDLSTTRDATIRRTSTDFRLLDYTLAAGSSALADGYITGLTMGRDPAETTTFNNIEFQTGQSRDTSNTANLVNGSVMVKTFDGGTFAFGTGGVGFPTTMTQTTGVWYRVFQIGRNTGGTVDFGFDTSATATTLLADANTAQGDSSWIYYRQLGWAKAASTTELVPFSNSPSDPTGFYWTSGDGFADYETGAYSAPIARAAITLDYAAPETTAILDWVGYNSAGSGNSDVWGMIQPLGHPDVAPTLSLHTVGANNPGTSAGNVAPGSEAFNDFLGRCEVLTDSSRQINVRWDGSSSNARAYCKTQGFRFKR